MRVLVLFIVALSLATHGLGANLCFSQTDFSNVDYYKSFIRSVREEFSIQTDQLYGIPILNPSLPDSLRFHFINLNAHNETITLAIDAEDMALVAYHAEGDKNSYFFSNSPDLALETLFLRTRLNLLSYNNTFQSLENAAGTSRLRIPLGGPLLESAIYELAQFNYEYVPESCLVVIQMILEAAKFKFIEQTVANSIRNGITFLPNLAIVSLEDNWCQLSLQIQASKSLQGLFGSVVGLYNSNNELIEVDSIYYPIILSNLALQLYHCQVSDVRDGIVPMQNYIKMPGVGGHDVHNNDKCYVQERTTSISGREGFCADVAGGLTADGSRLILYRCGQQANKKWTFQSDGTIRSSGKCLTTNNKSFGNSVVIYNCSKAATKDITWGVSVDGTIKNPSYDLVLTSKHGTRSTNLTMETNTYAASQEWRVGNYVNSIMTRIIGLQDMCLEATDKNTNMWLVKCVKNKTEQFWALYSDGTMRVNNDHSLCVTSPTDNSSNLITILSCNGSPNQRWLFMADGTVVNPKNEMLLMDVAQSNVNLKKIILYPRHDKDNQQWVVFY